MFSTHTPVHDKRLLPRVRISRSRGGWGVGERERRARRERRERWGRERYDTEKEESGRERESK